MRAYDEYADTIKAIFSVQCWESLRAQEDLKRIEIAGDIHLVDDDCPDESEPIGSLKADLINILAAEESDQSVFDLYDSHSAHLLDAHQIIFDCDQLCYREALLRKLKIDSFQIEWHLNLTRIDILPEHRGAGYAIRAFRLLRQYVSRPGLLVTAKAHPEPRDAPRKPRPAEVKALRNYYLSEPSLGFVPVGRATDGWLVANWSSDTP